MAILGGQSGQMGKKMSMAERLRELLLVTPFMVGAAAGFVGLRGGCLEWK